MCDVVETFQTHCLGVWLASWGNTGFIADNRNVIWHYLRYVSGHLQRLCPPPQPFPSPHTFTPSLYQLSIPTTLHLRHECLHLLITFLQFYKISPVLYLLIALWAHYTSLHISLNYFSHSTISISAHNHSRTLTIFPITLSAYPEFPITHYASAHFNFFPKPFLYTLIFLLG